MANSSDQDPDDSDIVRCPTCDFVVTPDQERCLMCGVILDRSIFPQLDLPQVDEPELDDAAPVEPVVASIEPIEKQIEVGSEAVEDLVAVPLLVTPEIDASQAAEDATPVETHGAEIAQAGGNSRPPQPPTPIAVGPANRPTGRAAVAGLFIFFALITLTIGLYAFFDPGAIPIVLYPSSTPQEIVIRPTITPSPTTTPTSPPFSPTPSLTPTATSTPLPTNTPQPPRTHSLESGQTLVGLAVLYDLTLDSILNLNNFTTESIVFEGQDILIPWPTATPPLQPIAVTIGAETVVVDPSNCPPFHTIEEGENLFFLASRNDVPLQALLEMNFLTIDSIVQPGDVICIPDVVEGPALIFTPGPSPTPGPTMTPRGPQPIYPSDEVEIPSDQTVLLQWLSSEPLGTDEYFMVELVDLVNVDARPQRAFTRANSLHIEPGLLNQPVNTIGHYRWEVRRVQALDQRSDGSLIYTTIGLPSEPRVFVWAGR